MIDAQLTGPISDKDAEVRPFKTLEIILKIVERCNLACPYCYYFFMGDETFKDRPPLLQPNVPEALVAFINEGAETLGFEAVRIVFHGGEPMMLPPKRFDAACSKLIGGIRKDMDLTFGIQTNGTLFTEEWLDLLEKYDVAVGVSMDGPKDIHDANRPDLHGNGSYDAIEEGLSLFRAVLPEKAINLGCITVIDAKYDYAEISRHLDKSLGFRTLNFLLPDCNHDDGLPDNMTATDYGRALCEIFDYYVETNTATVREMEVFLRRFQIAHYTDTNNAPRFAKQNQIVVVGSNGLLMVDDTYIPTGSFRQNAPTQLITDTTLKEWLDHDVFAAIDAVYDAPPDKCKTCKWIEVCNGGDFENRYSEAAGFNNPSVFCEGLKLFYEHAIRYLVENGYPAAMIETRLNGRKNAREGGPVWFAA